MSADIIREWNFWLASVLAGAGMAFLYDIFRLFRRLIRHGRLAVDLEDILYWAVCFGISFALLYYGNNGVIRFAAVIGAAVGMLVYVATLGRFFCPVQLCCHRQNNRQLLPYDREGHAKAEKNVGSSEKSRCKIA